MHMGVSHVHSCAAAMLGCRFQTCMQPMAPLCPCLVRHHGAITACTCGACLWRSTRCCPVKYTAHVACTLLRPGADAHACLNRLHPSGMHAHAGRLLCWGRGEVRGMRWHAVMMSHASQRSFAHTFVHQHVTTHALHADKSSACTSPAVPPPPSQTGKPIHHAWCVRFALAPGMALTPTSPQHSHVRSARTVRTALHARHAHDRPRTHRYAALMHS